VSAEPRELRILDGLHAGARTAVASVLSIGSALENDIVLSDPGIAANHAQLQWDATTDAWQLHREGVPPGPPLALGEAASLGPVWLTVAAANDPFEAGAFSAPAPALVPSSDVQHDDAAAPEPAGDAAPASASASALPRPPRRVDWPARLALALGATLLLFAGVGAVLFATRAASPPSAPKTVAAATSPTLRAQDVLHAQGLENRLTLAVSGSAAVVTGVLEDEARVERLAAGLAALNPRPAMRVWSLSGLRTLWREGGVVLPKGVSLGVAPDGAVVFGGPDVNRTLAAELQPRLRALLPAGVVLVNELERPELLAQRFVADARAQGFLLSGGAEDGKLLMTLHVPSAEQSRWETWLKDYAAQRLPHVGFSVAVHTPGLGAGPAPAGAAARSVTPPAAVVTPAPWRIRSVVGGAAPYLVLDDGAVLLPGARHHGAQLLAIGDSEVLIEVDGRKQRLRR
jgi:type III secretion protein D